MKNHTVPSTVPVCCYTVLVVIIRGPGPRSISSALSQHGTPCTHLIVMCRLTFQQHFYFGTLRGSLRFFFFVWKGLVGSRKETFASHNAALDKIQKSLEEYLETKRAAFPRFYFLSNDELVRRAAKSQHSTQTVSPLRTSSSDDRSRAQTGVHWPPLPPPSESDIQGNHFKEAYHEILMRQSMSSNAPYAFVLAR